MVIMGLGEKGMSHAEARRRRGLNVLGWGRSHAEQQSRGAGWWQDSWLGESVPPPPPPAEFEVSSVQFEVPGISATKSP